MTETKTAAPVVLDPTKPDPASTKRLRAMPSGDLESERDWLTQQMGLFKTWAFQGEPVSTPVEHLQAQMDAIMAEISRRIRLATLPRGGTRPSFDRAFLDDLRQATDIVALIEESGVELVKRGKEYKGVCLLHPDSDPSLSVSQEGGVWYCHGCHEGSDAIGWLTQVEGLEFRPAVEMLAQRAGMAPPQAPPRAATPDDGADGGVEALQGAPRAFHRTDLGRAERFAIQHCTRTRFCHTWATWLVWDGRRWKRDDSDAVRRLARDTIRSIYAEASRVEGDSDEDKAQRKAIAKFAAASEADRARAAMLSWAESDPDLAITADVLDRDPWLLNVENGTLDLRTGELRTHDPNDLITKLAPVLYDPGATLPLWDRFLEETTNSETDFAAFLARAVGITLTGNTEEEVVFLIHGPAATGKSTFTEAIKATLGEYATTADFETFLQKRSDGRPKSDVARLAGARLVSCVESGSRRGLAEGLIKWLTGGDTVVARYLFRNEFEFRPAFKLWLATNKEPKVSHDDDAIWRRLLKLPFVRTVPKTKRDPKVKATLGDPAVAGPAILAWAVRGCLDWQENGLQVPRWVQEVTEEDRQEQDPLAEFIDECCALGDEHWASAKALRGAYEAWCAERGEKPSTYGKAWGTGLRARGCRQDQRRVGPERITTRGWEGIGFVPDVPDVPA